MVVDVEKLKVLKLALYSLEKERRRWLLDLLGNFKEIHFAVLLEVVKGMEGNPYSHNEKLNPSLSQDLNKLLKANLVSRKRELNRSIYSLNKETLDQTLKIINEWA